MLLSSLNGLLGLFVLTISAAPQEPLGWPIPALDVQDVNFYAGIDAALESRQLIPLGQNWRFFPGTEEPSPGMEWVRADFDDSAWATGPSPFSFGPEPLVAAGTDVPDFGEGVSTLYLRCQFQMPNPDLYEGIWLEMLVNDGYILYFNKVEERRLHAGDFDRRQAFDATATSDRHLHDRPMPRFDLTRPIKTGLNQISIQTLISDRDRDSFGFYPSVRGIYRSTPESELAHFEEIQGLLEAAGAAEHGPQLLYLEARNLQRTGRFAQAMAVFKALSWNAPHAPIVMQRLVECARASDQMDELESWLRQGVLAGAPSAEWMNIWAKVWLEELGRDLGSLAALVPEDMDTSAASLLDDALWSARQLSAHQELRINMGANSDMVIKGASWSRQRFLNSSAKAAGSGLFATGVGSKRTLDGLADMLRIPVLNGTYGVTLWGTEANAGQTLDVYLEGTRRRDQNLDTGQAYVVQVRDGFLDLDLALGDGSEPSLAALELKLLGQDEALALARQAGSSAPMDTASTLRCVQLAEAEWTAGERLAALAAFERAEGQPSFNLEQRARLSLLREELLPVIVSQASAWDLAQQHTADWKMVLAAAEDAGGSDAAALAYFAGLAHQRSGELDDAIGYFEQLVFDNCPEPGPYIGMALCLELAELPEDAAGILDLALENGLAAEGTLLQTWISMQLGGMGVDPWELVSQLRKMKVAPQLVLVPTSEEFGQPWSYTHVEPTATTWSRPSFGIEHWTRGLGPIGAGFPKGGYPRALWNRIMLFARTSFELPAPNLLYPFLRVYGRGSTDTYLNGTRVARHSLSTSRYRQVPLRAPSVSGSGTTALSTGLLAGTNLLGMFGFNTRGPGQLDVGIYQDFGTLFWIQEQLREHSALRFNCGGEELIVGDGRVFHADRFYNWAIPGSLPADAESRDIAGTEDDQLYSSTRRIYDDSVSAWYEIPLPNGDYEVVLHFAELNPKYRESGSRSFDVTIEDVRVLSAFDVVAEAGFMSAITRSFDVHVVDGWMDIKLADKEVFSFVNAIEILAR